MQIRLTCLFVLMMLLLVGCAPGPSSGEAFYITLPPTVTATPSELTATPTLTPTPHPLGIAIDLGRPPVTLDPALVAPMDGAGRDLVENLFVGLTYLNPDTGRIEPWLAESWEISADRVRWVFHLRDDVWWVRTNPETQTIEGVRTVNASDVVYAARRACSLGESYPPARALFVIQGCQELAMARATGGSEEAVTLHVEALGDTTLEIGLPRPASYLLTLTSTPIMRPLPEENTSGGWPLPHQLWTSGPWVIEMIEENEATLAPNPLWPVARGGNLERLTLRFSEDTEPEARDQAGQTLAYPQITFAIFSFEMPPTNDLHVRRALALATDRALLIDWGMPITTFASPGTALAPVVRPGIVNPSAALEELSEAGYEDCRALPQITVLTDNSASSGEVALLLVSAWQEALDCPDSTFEVEQLPMPQVLTAANGTWQQLRPQVILLTWQGDYPDAHHWLADLFACRDTFPDAYLNQNRECSSVDEWVAQAASEIDADQRAALYTQIHNAWFAPTGDVLAIPLITPMRPLVDLPGLITYPTVAGPLRFDQWEYAPDED